MYKPRSPCPFGPLLVPRLVVWLECYVQLLLLWEITDKCSVNRGQPKSDAGNYTSVIVSNYCLLSQVLSIPVHFGELLSGGMQIHLPTLPTFWNCSLPF